MRVRTEIPNPGTVGRANDFIVLPSGKQLYPDTFVWFAAIHDGIDECFVHQNADGSVRISIVPAAHVTDVNEVFDSVRKEMFVSPATSSTSNW